MSMVKRKQRHAPPTSDFPVLDIDMMQKQRPTTPMSGLPPMVTTLVDPWLSPRGLFNLATMSPQIRLQDLTADFKISSFNSFAAGENVVVSRKYKLAATDEWTAHLLFGREPNGDRPQRSIVKHPALRIIANDI
jgi:hypothetical protein